MTSSNLYFSLTRQEGGETNTFLEQRNAEIEMCCVLIRLYALRILTSDGAGWWWLDPGTLVY